MYILYIYTIHIGCRLYIKPYKTSYIYIYTYPKCCLNDEDLREEALVPLSTGSGLLEFGPSVWLDGHGALPESPGGQAAATKLWQKWSKFGSG